MRKSKFLNFFFQKNFLHNLFDFSRKKMVNFLKFEILMFFVFFEFLNSSETGPKKIYERFKIFCLIFDLMFQH